MKITKVEAKYVCVSANIPVRDKPDDQGAMLVIIETDTGLRGVGMAREQDWHAVAVRGMVEHDIAPIIVGMDPSVPPEQLWIAVAGLAGRGSDYMRPAGAVSRAISAVDQALWDIRGQALGEPVYRLLGGAHDAEVDIYMTFGLAIYTPEEEAEAARRLVKEGHTAFKLQGDQADKAENIDIDRDVARVKQLREIVGDKAKIMLNARGPHTLYDATILAKRIEQYDMAFLDEPLLSRDPDALRELRRAVPGVPIATRGRGDIAASRDLISMGAVDVMGSSVMDQGGYTQSIKIAHMAELYGLRLVTGGGNHALNAHLIAAVSNGWMTEYHAMNSQLTEALFIGSPMPEKGKLRLSKKPGLGLKLNDDAVAEAVERGRTAGGSSQAARIPIS